MANGRTPSVARRTDLPGCARDTSTTACGPMMGSGPSSKGAAAAPPTTSVSGSSHCSGRSDVGKPSKRNPPALARQRTGDPITRERARADSSKAAKRSASRSSCTWDESRIANPTPAETTATMATTTSSSSKVKPAVALALRLPAADVCIFALATGLAVSTEGHHIHLALDAGTEVDIGVSPGVIGQQIKVLLPVDGRRTRSGLGEQRLQALLGGGVTLVVKLVELERLHQVVHIRLGRRDAGVVCAVQHVGHDQGRQHPNNQQHHHELDQGEAALDMATPW